MSIGPWVFNGFDILVLLVVLISLLSAAGRGLFRELISIIALIVAVIVTMFVWGRFHFSVQKVIKPEMVADAVLGAGTFFLCYIIVTFLLSGLSKKGQGDSISLIDRILGAVFGAARGLLLAALATMLLSAQYHSAQETQELKAYLEQNPDAIPPEVLPREIREQMEAPPPELPTILQNSTLFPILDRIGDSIRALPFARMRSLADRIKSGDLSAISEELY